MTTTSAPTFDAWGTTHIELPTPEQTAEHLSFLLRTAIPHQYRAAKLAAATSLAGGRRPSNARIQHAFDLGTVHGIQLTVQALFGYYFHTTAADLLDAAVGALTQAEVA